MQDSGISILFKGINFQRLLGGLWVTMRIALITIGLSLILGLAFGLIMLSRRRIPGAVCRIWLEAVRFMPQLVLLYMVYFGFARLFGWDLDGETSAVIVFTFWGTAEMGDLVRGAVSSIPAHQRESADALGLTQMQVYRHVLIPQTIRRLLPQAINLSTRIIKTTALVKMINVTEVLKVGQQIIGQFYRLREAPFWVYLSIFILYFLICWPISVLAGWLEKRWA
ncbi:MAG: amino acid ABC transporter permease [Clostridiales bacterium]|nr:amino acid ABC transporter permease [Clostridiales bacterium]